MPQRALQSLLRRVYLQNASVKSLSMAFAVLLASSLASALPVGPLVVDGNSHVVVMEYEAWFGPHAATFQGFPAMPLLQSADMKPVGGGYDSADPAVIKQHVAWLESLGVDAAISEVTNNVSCIFNSEWFVKKYIRNCSPSFRRYNQNIRNNTGNLYPAWSALGTRLKLIPLLGGIDGNVLIKDQDGKTAFEKEVEYFGALLQEHPDRSVIYEGKPLMLIFLGAAQDPNPADNPLWYRIEQFLQRHPEISGQYTFKLMAGYLDSQPGLWATQGTPDGPVEISPAYGFWSWVDRLNTSCTEPLCPYYPSYNQAGSRVENFTASLATAGQDGWGCPNPNAPPYCPDDALRFGSDGGYDTFHAFMIYAKQLDPIFLMLHQFNEFALPDEGFDANTNDEIEPANLWGSGGLKDVRDEIQAYRQATH
ncbi:MAG: hypothetical protein WAL71_13935 [Terriglobales bacterium]